MKGTRSVRFPKRERYRPLGPAEHQYIAQYIRSLVPVARDPNHPMGGLAQWLIAIAMWRWTADGVDKETGRVVRDALKYDVSVQGATKEAREATGVRGLRHEHIVPRALLARRIIDEDLNTTAIVALLTRCCRAVIVTRKQDKVLRPREAMPPAWNWEVGDPYARYVHSNLLIEVNAASKKGS